MFVVQENCFRFQTLALLDGREVVYALRMYFRMQSENNELFLLRSADPGRYLKLVTRTQVLLKLTP